VKYHPILVSSAVILAALGMTAKVSATPQIAGQFGTADCTLCHTSMDGSQKNLRPGVAAAYDTDKKNLTALRQLLEGGSPTTNTKPTLGLIGAEWDAEVGQTLNIPLSVSDNEQDSFEIVGKYPSGSFSAEYTADNSLPTVDYQFTPSAAQANKVYKVKFQAKETDTAKKYASNAIQAKLRVWPAGDRDQAYVSKWLVAKTKWQNGSVSLSGKVVLNKLMTAEEKSAFLSRNDLVADISQGADGLGAAISVAQPLSFDNKGNWSLTNLPLAEPFACSLTVEFEGKKASRKIAGAPKTCLK